MEWGPRRQGAPAGLAGFCRMVEKASFYHGRNRLAKKLFAWRKHVLPGKNTGKTRLAWQKVMTKILFTWQTKNTTRVK
jgi:hypothetical protein